MNDSNEKKRILFVDDEPNVLSGLRRTLRGQRNVWDMEFVDSGQAALSKMAEYQFDAVVTDMRMPGMDGARLLERVAEDHPEVVRVILSGQSDQETVMKTVGPAHQYLNKPCEIEVLKGALTRAFSLRAFLKQDRLKSLVSGMRTLPSLPEVYGNLMKVIQDPNASVVDVGKVIAQDPAMTAKILQLVNSAFFGLGRHISNPVDAASLLGLDVLQPLVLSIGIFKQFESERLGLHEFSLDELWNHSFQVGAIAKLIATSENMEAVAVEDCILAGTLHDIGKLVLILSAPDAFANIEESKRKNLNLRVEEETEIFGATHGAVGAYLLGLWGLPQPVVEAVAMHEEPSLQAEKVFSVLTVIHAANALAHLSDQQTEVVDIMDYDYLASLSISGKIEAWKVLVENAQEAKE